MTRRRSANGGTANILMMKSSSLCNGLKSHLLVHISQYTERFAGGPHTGTERGEQQHKFMRELLCHTNRQKGGRDVAIRFAEECMVCHISQGGLFMKNSSASVYETCGTSEIQSYDSTVNENKLEFLDNNNSIRKLVLRLNGLFQNVRSSKSSVLSLGKVAFKEGQNFIIEASDFVLRNVIPQDQDTCIYKSCLLNIIGNVVTRRFPNDDFTIAGHEQNRVFLVLDMLQPPLLDSSHNNSSSLLTINKSKFGSF
ncbi:hypothetical protein INT47_005845 [Mucor saturninus]|uniref:Uncharacterized protein n=1 Tax=Mucor saturninus TaxID=64648 RepID=A0A8H7QXN6_9FUNG|nr:hypothetical protein INT47_005845 [Mucor saturninus]